MELFIDRLPFTGLSVSLPILACEPGLASPTSGQPTSGWIVDTGYVGEAFAWRQHLSTAGLDPDTKHYHRVATLRSSAFGSAQRFPVRRADLWLTSNMPDKKDRYYCLPIDEGIVFRDEEISSGQARTARALIGMRLLKRSQLKFEVDFVFGTYSVWIP